jgi:hypothetical protein
LALQPPLTVAHSSTSASSARRETGRIGDLRWIGRGDTARPTPVNAERRPCPTVDIPAAGARRLARR